VTKRKKRKKQNKTKQKPKKPRAAMEQRKCIRDVEKFS
jgi:hypothetical protein